MAVRLRFFGASQRLLFFVPRLSAKLDLGQNANRADPYHRLEMRFA